MMDPVDLDNFFIAFFSAAMVILMGAAYALLFAWSKLRKVRLAAISAYCSYGLLVVSVLFLADAMNFSGYWQILVWVMLAGYLWAPHGIWHLCQGTHAASDSSTGTHDKLTLTGNSNT